MRPEDEARQEIDQILISCGWVVQDCAEMDISAGPGVAVREFPLQTGAADYLLYADRQAIGVIEAKPKGHTLIGVEPQSLEYVCALPENIPAHRRPLPFHYESTGVVTQFTNLLDPEPRSREVFSFHRPEELVRLVGLDRQLRAGMQAMPDLDTGGLWPPQIEAMHSLEASLAQNRPRSLIQMATGSGKTFLACSFCYRLIKFAGARRVLFLVDRNTLGNQACTEFTQYRSPYSNMRFGEEFNVQLLSSNAIMPASRVVITTIQRLYSMLQGEPEFDAANEEQSHWETGYLATREPIPVEYNPAVPIEAFDVIVVDECHRSIYNQWRQVLDYFDAHIIGLTATPSKQTIGFFDRNLVMEYTHPRAVADGVNVDFQVYRIRTRVTENGSTVDAHLVVGRRDRRTRAVRYEALDEDLTYTASELDRDVVTPDQIRTIVRTFRDRVLTDVFPGREYVPKTLVFAKDDAHAEEITRIVREEFGKGNDFCQKITYRTTGKKPEDVLQEFRTAFNPRIAVTVDMIATGTDVKPIECLVFMRNVRSLSYFEQMKGRGVRVIDPDELQHVTPDAPAKTHFVIVDAVGVCESDLSLSESLNRNPSVPLKKLLDTAAKGVVAEDLASTLGSRLARLDQAMSDEQRGQVTQANHGQDLHEVVGRLLTSVDPDAQAGAIGNRAQELGRALTEQEADDVRRQMVREALTPFHNPRLREAVLQVQQSLEQTIDVVTLDELIDAGHDEEALERARSLIASFEQFIADNRDEIEVLQILYSRPYRERLRFADLRDLADQLRLPPVGATPETLWTAYEQVEPEHVQGHGGRRPVDVVALVRHAIAPEEPLIPVAAAVRRRYDEWLDEQRAAGVIFSHEQRQWLDAICDHIANSLRFEADDFGFPPFVQLGGMGRAYELFGDRLDDVIRQLNERLAA